MASRKIHKPLQAAEGRKKMLIKIPTVPSGTRYSAPSFIKVPTMSPDGHFDSLTFAADVCAEEIQQVCQSYLRAGWVVYGSLCLFKETSFGDRLVAIF